MVQLASTPNVGRRDIGRSIGGGSLTPGSGRGFDEPRFPIPLPIKPALPATKTSDSDIGQTARRNDGTNVVGMVQLSCTQDSTPAATGSANRSDPPTHQSSFAFPTIAMRPQRQPEVSTATATVAALAHQPSGALLGARTLTMASGRASLAETQAKAANQALSLRS